MIKVRSPIAKGIVIDNYGYPDFFKMVPHGKKKKTVVVFFFNQIRSVQSVGMLFIKQSVKLLL